MFSSQIGFMQGRLTHSIDGKIQAFPKSDWKQEFAVAGAAGFRLIEWTLDYECLYENPILTQQGRKDIQRLKALHDVALNSLTGDCFMQAPFFKATSSERQHLENQLDAVIDACGEAGITYIIFPLVDNGSLQSIAQRDVLIGAMLNRGSKLEKLGVHIIFESDLGPQELADFITLLPGPMFGIN